MHKFGSKVLPGIFIGYHQKHGGTWSGDMLVADWEQIENAENSRDIYVKRFDAKEIFPIQLSGKFRFPIAEGDLRQPGDRTKHNRKKPSRNLKEDEDEEEEALDEKGDSEDRSAEGIREPIARGDSQREKDFWSLSSDVLVRHHIEPRTRLFTPNDPTVKPPIPLKYINVTRVAQTDLSDKSEAEINDAWWSQEQTDSENCYLIPG